ncbi:VOC family protein [Fulvivirgaceae bacterium BMA10]|uniref:VOC family protein n=1 Tax=Splendidivirga corallicola TaxID=3051826 RepID=A0ABT8KQK1_9BACT|nr:VOC family protein [Fulvivirgaceae bacterium BMA10]
MNDETFTIEGLTMAVTNMEAMVNFYSDVFNVEFRKLDLYGGSLYQTDWGDLQLLLCPSEIAQVSVNRNRHQFDIVVSDLNMIIDKAKQAGGRLMGNVNVHNGQKVVSIFDPDGNSIVFKEKK